MYLDDRFLMGLTFQECWNTIDNYLKTFMNLGFLPHPEKCMLWPSQQVSILGFIIDSISMTVTISQEKMDDIYNICVFALQNPEMTIRQLCRIIGKLISVFLALPLGQAHYRCLEVSKILFLCMNAVNLDAMCKIPRFCFPDLVWWTNHTHSATAPIRRSAPEITLYVDSSGFGWGGTLFEFRAQGKFLPDEKSHSINTKECLAIYYGVRSFLHLLRNKHVCIRSDSSCAVSSANKMGSCSSMAHDLIMHDLWTLCEHNNMWLTAVHLSGILNKEVDQSSRVFNDRIMWTLPQVHFDKIKCLYPQIDVDLFSSYNTAHMVPFVAWTADPFAMVIDVFLLNWSQFTLPYIFAPNSVNMKVFQQLRRDQSTAIIIIRVWPRQPWWSLFLQSLVDFPRRIPWHPGLFLPRDETRQHPLADSMQLVTAKVSGIRQKVLDFQKVLASISACIIENKLNYNMGLFSNYWRNFVVNGSVIYSL